MRIRVVYHSNLYCAWGVSGGIPATLERMGHELVDDDDCDLVLVSGPEHTDPKLWIEAKSPKAVWFHESCYRDGDNFLAQFRTILKYADFAFFPAAQDTREFGGSWLPFGVDTEIFRPDGSPRTHGVAFIGQVYAKRREYLARLRAAGLNLDCFSCADSPVALGDGYRSIKVLLNLPAVSQLVVTRVTEGMACGCVVVTPELKGTAARNMVPFKDCEHLFYYDADDLGSLAHALALASPADHVGEAASTLIASEHSLENRMTTILRGAGVSA